MYYDSSGNELQQYDSIYIEERQLNISQLDVFLD
jgi:hypothetical protein